MSTIVVDKFINVIGFDFKSESRSALASVEKGLKSIRKLAIVSGVALSGLGIALDRVASGIDDQAKFARGINVSFEKLQQLQFAAQKAGVPVDDLNGFLENLAKTSASTLPGDFNTALQSLGISAKDAKNNLKDPLTLILEISDRLKELPKGEQIEFGGTRLGASVKMINLLVEGSGQIVKDMKEARDIGGVIPESLTKDVAEFFDDSLLRVTTTLSVLSKTILVSFLPAISKALNKFEDWVIVNRKVLSSRIGDFIKGVSKGLSDFAGAMSKVGAVATKFFQKISDGGSSLDFLNTVSIAVEASLLALTAAFLASKAEIILLGAVLFKLSDLMRSVFDRTDKLINIFSVEFPDATRVFKEGIEALFAPIDTLVSKLDKFVAIKDKFDKFKDIFSKVNPLAPILALPENIDATSASLGSRVVGASNSNPSVPISKAAASNNSSTNNTSNNESTNNVTINVNGAGDPSAVAREVKSQMDLSDASKIANPGFNRPRYS